MEDIFGWLFLPQAAKHYVMDYNKIKRLAESGHIPRATKVGCHWLIPKDLDPASFVNPIAERKPCVRQRKYHGKTQGPEMLLEDYKILGTITAVARKYEVTRSEISRILRKAFGDYKKLKPLEDRWKCKWCGERKSQSHMRFCSNECWHKSIEAKWQEPEKVCSVCNLPKPRDRFALNKKDGVGRTHSVCYDCRISRNKTMYALRKAGLLPILRVGDGKNCSKCGEFRKWGGFSDQFLNKDGKNSHCRICETKYQIQWRKIKTWRKHQEFEEGE